MATALNESFIMEDQLHELAGTKQRAALMRYLDQVKIEYKVGRSGVWTTMQAINDSLGSRMPTNHERITIA